MNWIDVAASRTGASGAFLTTLRADAPAAELGAEAGLYGWLIGSWELDMLDFLPDGTRRETPGEVHFGWVLEGRAVQDVWIAPPRPLRTRDGSPAAEGRNTYGTTLRVYDPRLGAWRITWINPVSGVEERMIGRRSGDRIVQDGRRADGSLIRWSFSDITPTSFTWRGECSRDDGATWFTEAEFHARRTVS